MDKGQYEQKLFIANNILLVDMQGNHSLLLVEKNRFWNL
uniref:Uncharacterized protein n=1 Tax=Rhizophora mucronata TaxID=61149 RepID=A0A2P2PNP1_RHIMU